MHYIFCIMETNSHQTEIKVNTQKWVFHLSLLQLIESEITLIYKYNGPPHLWIGGVGSWVGLIQKKVIIKANLAASIFFLLYIICHKANPKVKMHGSPDDAFPLQSQTLMHQRQITICIGTKCFTCWPYPLWNLCCCGGGEKSTHIISVLF